MTLTQPPPLNKACDQLCPLTGTVITTCASLASLNVWEHWGTHTTKHHWSASFWRRLLSTKLSQTSREAPLTTSCLPSLTEGNAGNWSSSPIVVTTAMSSSSGARRNFRRCGPSPLVPKPKCKQFYINLFRTFDAFERFLHGWPCLPAVYDATNVFFAASFFLYLCLIFLNISVYNTYCFECIFAI